MHKSRIFILLTFITLLIGTLGWNTGHGVAPLSASADSDTDGVLVKFRPGVSAAERSAVHQQVGGRVKDVIPGIDVDVVVVPSGRAAEAVSRYQQSPRVQYAEVDAEAHLVDATVDPSLSKQWGLFTIKAPLALAATLAPSPPDPGPATHIVVFHGGVDPDVASLDLGTRHGLTREFVYRHALLGASLVIPPGKEAAVQSDPRVAFLERNQKVTLFNQPAPTGVNRIDAEGVGGPVDVDIAIIDTGIDLTHPDLNVVASTNCAWGGQFNQTCTDGQGADDNGHGSHVAGTAAARNNSIGVLGVAPDARLWAVKVLDNAGKGYESWVIAGVDWVTVHASQIEVANMSLGCECTMSALDLAIANSVKAGVTYAVAAGNSNKDASTFSPAKHSDVITVSAMVDSDGRCGGLGPSTSYGADDTRASFSNYGSLVELAAPGVNIYSTYKTGGYATGSGTSMASPHVAGAAALYKAANALATPTDVRNALMAGGVAQTKACDTSLNNGNAGFRGDPDIYHEPLAYVGSSSSGTPATADFSMAASPSSQTVTAGVGTSYTVTLTSLNGYASAVNFSVTWLPSGASSSFSSNPVTPTSGGATSMLTVSTSMAGTYILIITGTGTDLANTAHSASVTLVVTIASTDFSIAASPSARSIPAGKSAAYKVTLTALNGYASAVNLSVTWLPSGASSSFSSNPVTPTSGGATSMLTVSTSTAGTYILIITGTGTDLANTAHSASVKLMVK